MMHASLLAGFAFSNAGLGAVHSLSHALGALLDLPLGLCNALLLPQVAAYNQSACPEKYERIRLALLKGFSRRGVALPGDTLQELLLYLRKEVLPEKGLQDYGMQKSMIPELARKAYRDPCLAMNPRKPLINDLESLYEKVL